MEVVYHFYEEYAPLLQERRNRETPPIIVQTVPHISVSNFFGPENGVGLQKGEILETVVFENV